jgi:pimeloyl-ACP methyl ester carboxylesterase
MTTALVLLVLVVAATFAGMAALTRVRAANLAFRYEREGRDVEVDGGALNILELGVANAEGPPVVLIHGSGANLLDLKVSLGERLARDRRVFLVDRPGHGWSGRIARDDVDTPEGQAIALSEALGRIGVERPIMVGHDWGGAMALSYALSFPEEVAGLVVIAPVSHQPARTPALVHRLVAMPWAGRILSEVLAPTWGQMAQRLTLKRSFAPQEVPGYFADSVAAALELQPAAFASDAQDIVALGPFLAEQSAYYRQITVPLVIITGDEDAVTPPAAQAEKLAGDVEDSRLVILNDVGHMAHHSSPNVIAFEVNRLADRL